jgi:hypothetical protein
MALSFPSSPTVGQTSSQNGRLYTWSGYAWELTGNVAGHSTTHGASGSDPVTVAVSQISDLAAGANAAARMYLWQTFR